MATLTVRLITPKGEVASFETELFNTVTSMGALGLMANHTPLVAQLVIHRAHCNVDGTRKEYTIAGGVLSLVNNEILVVSDAIEDIDSIDIDRANRAKQRALARLENQRNEIDIVRAQLALQRALNRLNEH